MKTWLMSLTGFGVCLLVLAAAAGAGQRWESEQTDWCLACKTEIRELAYPVQVPAWASRLIIRVEHGYDDTGDRKAEVLLFDSNGRIILSDKTGSRDWAEFTAAVNPGGYTIVLRDLDTKSGGDFPGNGGAIQYVLEGVDAPPTSAVTPQSNAAYPSQYMGCFRDQGDPSGTEGRDLPGFVFASDAMTVGTCITLCSDKGFAYAGLQFASWCFCGNVYGRSGPADNCTMPCSGNNSEICGGAWANSVYSTGISSSLPGSAGALYPSSELENSQWQFGRADGTIIAQRIRLLPGGKIEGYYHPNEDHWGVEEGYLVFYHKNGAPTCRFSSSQGGRGNMVLSGQFLFDQNIIHVLKEIQ